MKWKMPPKAKIYEAISAVLDGRVSLLSPGVAEVTSSSGERRYKVTWNEAMDAFASNDNASKFQGYIGYPIIAVLLLLDRLDFAAEGFEVLKGVPWKELNDRFKRDYDKAVDHVLSEASEEQRTRIHQMVDGIYAELAGLELERPGKKGLTELP